MVRRYNHCGATWALLLVASSTSCHRGVAVSSSNRDESCSVDAAADAYWTLEDDVSFPSSASVKNNKEENREDTNAVEKEEEEVLVKQQQTVEGQGGLVCHSHQASPRSSRTTTLWSKESEAAAVRWHKLNKETTNRHSYTGSRIRHSRGLDSWWAWIEDASRRMQRLLSSNPLFQYCHCFWRDNPIDTNLRKLLFQQKAISIPSADYETSLRVRERTTQVLDELEQQQQQEPHVGMLLSLVHPRKQSNDDRISYELLEVMHIELGGRAIHANDYAYTPVLSGRDRVVEQPKLLSSTDAAIATIGDSIQDETNEKKMMDSYAAQQHLEESHPSNAWWQWWIPRRKVRYCQEEGDPFQSYTMNRGAFAGGSHGQVWRGRRRCNHRDTNEQKWAANTDDSNCRDQLILKRLKVENGYRILEAGLREIHFGQWIAQQEERYKQLFTHYVEHFFREDTTIANGAALDLWIVFRDAGPTLRSYLYTGIIVGDLVIYQQSALWTKMRLSVSPSIHSRHENDIDVESTGSKALQPMPPTSAPTQSPASHNSYTFYPLNKRPKDSRQINHQDAFMGREIMRSVLRQILEAAAFLHSNGIVHRDIKPSNIMCQSNITIESIFDDDVFPTVYDTTSPPIRCVLGDLSSAWSLQADRNLYTVGPSRYEQTDEYAPPEAIFGFIYNTSDQLMSPAFDSWSIGILALEMLLGSPNVFTVDQRTRAILTHKLTKEGASENEIRRALYLAALSQFCIYNPRSESQYDRILRIEDPIHRMPMVKSSCTLHDFHRALRARDPLGIGFDNSSDTLLHLIWQLLAWNPDERILPDVALKHKYFTRDTQLNSSFQADTTALESLMLDPRMDFNISDAVSLFVCPKCGREFNDWNSCLQHVRSRKHAKFCTYDKTNLPSCLSSHSMLPADPYSGYCDIQGRRRTIEDFHSIRLHPEQQFYGIFDGHTGNLASKYVASHLYDNLNERLSPLLHATEMDNQWKDKVTESVGAVFAQTHDDFLTATSLVPHAYMDQSGSTATAAFVTTNAIIVASLGDSRAVLSSYSSNGKLTAIQLTNDHVASDLEEKAQVELRGGRIVEENGVSRVDGVLVITRSIGDAKLSPQLSRTPHVVVLTRVEAQELCGMSHVSIVPCFLILASDGLWDTMSNQEAVDMVSEVVTLSTSNNNSQSSRLKLYVNWNETTGMQQAAEALTMEAYVRGSRDNIGVVVVAITT